MSASDLQEIRAMLRAQPALVEARSPLSGLKRLLGRREPVAAPVDAREAWSAPTPIAPDLATTEAASLLVAVEPAADLSPPRASFGLAERLVEATPEPVVIAPMPIIDLSQPIVVAPRRQAIEAGAIGAEEVMELRELLAERLPHLLTPAVETALEEHDPFVALPAPAPVAAEPVLAAPAPAQVAKPDWSRRAICFTPARVEMAAEQALLSDLYARLTAEHDAVRARLAQVATPEPVRAAA